MAARESEACGLMRESFNNHGVFCIRFPRARLTLTGLEEETPFGKWKKELSGVKTAIVSVGPSTLELKELLESSKKNVSLFNAIYQKPMDEEIVDKELLSYDKVIIYDAYAVENGFAKELVARLVKNGYKGEIIVRAVPDVFVEHASQKEQLQKFELLPEQIIELL